MIIEPNPKPGEIAVRSDIPSVAVIVDSALIERRDAVMVRWRAIQGSTIDRDNVVAVDAIVCEAKSILAAIERSRVATKAAPLELCRMIDATATEAKSDLATIAKVGGDAVVAVAEAIEREAAEAEAKRREAERAAAEREAQIVALARQAESDAAENDRKIRELLAKPTPSERAAIADQVPAIEAAAAAIASEAAEIEQRTIDDQRALDELRSEHAAASGRAFLATLDAPAAELPKLGTRGQRHREVEIFDKSKVPIELNGAELRPVHEPTIRRLALLGVEIPGVRVVETKRPHTSGATKR